jgi:hypothetical protein
MRSTVKFITDEILVMGTVSSMVWLILAIENIKKMLVLF